MDQTELNRALIELHGHRQVLAFTCERQAEDLLVADLIICELLERFRAIGGVLPLDVDNRIAAYQIKRENER